MSKHAALLLVLTLLMPLLIVPVKPVFAVSLVSWIPMAASDGASSLSVKAENRIIVVPDMYPTIEAAIENAAEGNTIFVRKGTYEGPRNQTLVIGKKLWLTGEDPNQTKLTLHPEWVTTYIFPETYLSGYASPIRIEADDVEISGFTLASDGGDIVAIGNRTRIIGNIVETDLRLGGINQTFAFNILTAGLNSDGNFSRIVGNEVVGGRIGCHGYCSTVWTNNVTGERNYYGIDLGGSDPFQGFHVVYNNNVIAGDGVSANSYGNLVFQNTVANCTLGISIDWGFDNIIVGNTIINNQGPGIKKYIGMNNTFYANNVANNSIGVSLGSMEDFPGKTTLYHNNFIDNLEQTQIVNLDHSDYWDNGQEGNYWSDYASSDSDLDGIGDAPYVIFGDRHLRDYPWVIYGDNYSDRFPLMTPFSISNIQTDLPDWAAVEGSDEFLSHDTTAPAVAILSPENDSTLNGDCSLTFVLNEQPSWMGYSLDGKEVVTVLNNVSIGGLSNGLHNVIVYAKDSFGNLGASGTIRFTVFPTTLVIGSIALVVVVGTGLLVYLKKYGRGKTQ